MTWSARLRVAIGAYDVLMANQAQRHRATLVPSNVSKFSRVSELHLDPGPALMPNADEWVVFRDSTRITIADV